MSNSQISVMPDRATCLSFVSKEIAKLQKRELNTLKSGEVLVKTAFSGISRGTERLVFQGAVPKSEYRRMRCPNQIGEFPFPVTYGYACVGEVIRTGPGVESPQVGETVFAMHPHQDFFVVPGGQTCLVPRHIDPSLAVLSANMETALNAVWDAELGERQQVAVIGAGVVGLLTAFLASRQAGCSPVIIDVDERKRHVARTLGLQFLTVEEANAGKDGHFDRVFHTSASEKGLQLAIDIAGFESRIIEMSWYGTRPVNLFLGGSFHSQRLQIISSQVGHVSPTRRDEVSHATRLRTAMDQLTEPALRMLLHPVVPFSELPGTFEEILDPKNDALCPLVTYMNQEVPRRETAKCTP